MRAFAFVSGVLSFGGFILSLLCLFAGSRPGFLEDASVLTISISNSGKELLLNGTIHGNSSLSSELGSIASRAGISDWYSMHILNYCEGSYANSTSEATESCSASAPFFSFDPIEIIQSEFKDGFNISLGGLDADVNVSASGWPSQIRDVFGNAETAYKVVFVVMCAGIASAGVEGIVSMVVFAMGARRRSHGTAVSLINVLFGTISFLGLGLAAAIITGTMFTLVNTINAQGVDVGLGASKGKLFLWMAWSATALMLLTTCLWLLDYMIERRAKRREIQRKLDGLENLDNGNTLLLDYRSHEKALKAEKKAFEKRQAAERAMIKAARFAPAEQLARGYGRPLPVEVIRHEVIQPTGASSNRPFEQFDPIQDPGLIQGHPHVVQREFV